MPGASKGVLSKQLNELINDHLIEKIVYDQTPPKVEYSLSKTGENFTSVLDVLKDWSEEYIKEYQNKRQELLDQENDISVRTINIDDIADVKLDFIDLEMLSFMIDE